MRAGTVRSKNDNIIRIERISRFRSVPRGIARIRHSLEVIVDRTVADLNITHFRKLLADETDPVKRQTIDRLLAEEEAKLARAQASKADSSDKA